MATVLTGTLEDDSDEWDDKGRNKKHELRGHWHIHSKFRLKQRSQLLLFLVTPKAALSTSYNANIVLKILA